MDRPSSIRPNDRLRQERMRRHWRQQDVADQLGTTTVTVKRWERGRQQPSAYYRLKLCALFEKSAEELGLVLDSLQSVAPTETEVNTRVETVSSSSSIDASCLWSVPHPRNPFFTGRDELLQSLHKQLHRERTLALSQSWAISGLGGIGKTQIALEYAYRYRQDYRSVFWTSAATQQSLQTGIFTLAKLLRIPEPTQQDYTQALQAVKQWFTTHDGWLWILDNADDLSLVQQVMPAEQPGHVLLTSRAQALGSLAQRMEVENMGLAEGTLFLLRRAKLLSPDAFLDSVQEDHLAAAEAIVLALDFLPLALD
ncbi:MAG: helix-turn-helix transcriptional regulator, partial [Ktedonobacteraceae bacterium]|nr:helix-turn-helix transcriptional regulator [Ktedonobacteraceae bacterium]